MNIRYNSRHANYIFNIPYRKTIFFIKMPNLPFRISIKFYSLAQVDTDVMKKRYKCLLLLALIAFEYLRCPSAIERGLRAEYPAAFNWFLLYRSTVAPGALSAHSYASRFVLM